MNQQAAADDAPTLLSFAIGAVWLTLAVSGLVALVDVRRGDISQTEFIGRLAIYGALCLIPYKLTRRSNAARISYLVLNVVGLLFALGGGDTGTRLETVTGWLLMPVHAWALYVLFLTPVAALFARRSP